MDINDVNILNEWAGDEDNEVTVATLTEDITLTENITIHSSQNLFISSIELTIPEGVVLYNGGTIINEAGTITNETGGTITNETGGIITNHPSYSGSLITNNGYLDNGGEITNSKGTIYNKGEFRNSKGGRFINGDCEECSFFHSDARIINTGFITNEYGCIIINKGEITNAGEIDQRVWGTIGGE